MLNSIKDYDNEIQRTYGTFFQIKKCHWILVIYRSSIFHEMFSLLLCSNLSLSKKCVFLVRCNFYPKFLVSEGCLP